MVYQNVASHHLFHRKLKVIRTLLDRCDSIVTEDDEKIREKTTKPGPDMATLLGPSRRLKKIARTKKAT